MISPKSLFSPFIPTDFRPLLSCVTPNAFRVIEWRNILSFAPTLAKRIATDEGKESLKTHLRPWLTKNIIFNNDANEFSKVKLQLKSLDGSSILALYFAQFNCDEGMFLDLRSNGFSLSDEGQIIWRPNGLWIRLDPKFRKGMLSVYKGYYLNQPELLRQGLESVGLIKDHFSEDLVSEIEQMLISHIGGDTSSQKFKVAHFTQSFEKLFQFLIKENIVLPPDFLYLGLYLGGLYIHLESLGESYDVRKAFLESTLESGSRIYLTNDPL
jgi:hypothetical protein